MSQSFGSQDINAAVELIRKNGVASNRYTKYSGVFLFTTENQAGINKVISYKDKDVATIAASGDQYLGAVYYGGKKVDIFDINRLTYYITCLKIAAIYVLDYKDFMAFFLPVYSSGKYNPSFWNYYSFRKLFPVMPNIVGAFWERVMYALQVTGGFGHFAYPDDDKYVIGNVMSGMPFYQFEEEYYKLQSLLRKREFPKFFEADIRDLSKVLTSSYDIVYLSNALEDMIYFEVEAFQFEDLVRYMGDMANIDPRTVPNDYYNSYLLRARDDIERRLTKEVLDSVMPYVNEDGTVLLGYSSNRPTETTTNWLYDKSGLDVDIIASKFPPIMDMNRMAHTDLVLTYRPKKGPVKY